MKTIKPLREKKNTAILLIHCPDKQGILATVTEFLNKNGGNILYLDQHVDRQEQIFYMQQRGLTEAAAMSLAVNGFVNDLVRQFPMEYSVELKRLIELEMEGSVG